MPRDRNLARLAITSVVAAALALTGVVLATPAYADDPVDVNVDAPRSATPGRVGTVSVRLENDSNQEYFPVQTVFTIRMAGLPVNGVMISQGGVPLAQSGSDGAVTFTAGLNVRLAPRRDRGDTVRTQYEIVFTGGVPGGRAEVVAEAFVNGQRLGGDSDRISVRGGRGDFRPTTTTPPNTDPGIIPTFSAPPTYSLAPLQDSSPLASVDPSFPPYFYVLGVVLLGTGGALLWLLYRQRRSEASTAGGMAAAGRLRFPGIIPSRGAGRHAVHQPTTVLPTVTGPLPPTTPPRPPTTPPRPPVTPPRLPHLAPPEDPWSNPPTDRTREFDPFEDPRGPQDPGPPRHRRY